MWNWLLSILLDNNILFLVLLCICFWYWYVNTVGSFEIFWFTAYFIITGLILIFFLIEEINIITIYFFHQIIEPIIVLDPTIFMYNFLYFIFNCSFVLFFYLFFFYLFLYLSSSYYKYNQKIYIYFCIMFVFYLNITFWILKYDLFLSNWFSFSYIPKFSLLFDFQLDLETFLYFFWSDYWELFTIFFILYFLTYFIFLQGGSLTLIARCQITWILLCFFIFFNLYSFSEFNCINDFAILFSTIWFYLCIEISFYFLYYLKKYK